MMQFVPTTRYEILLGLQQMRVDAVERPKAEIIDLIAKMLQMEEAGFSIVPQKGGYCYLDGIFMTESALSIRIIGGEEHKVRRLAQLLKEELCQETVIIKAVPIEVCIL